MASFEEMYDVDYYRKKAAGYISEINEFMQGFRVLCVSTHKESERAWCSALLALDAGKPVVTANKALLAECAQEIFAKVYGLRPRT